MDKTAYLPDGTEFVFWEQEQQYERELHVDCNHPRASDQNEGSKDYPFKTMTRFNPSPLEFFNSKLSGNMAVTDRSI
jgi:hypothetical protein